MSRLARYGILIVVVFAAGFAGGWVNPGREAVAHAASTYYNEKWPQDSPFAFGYLNSPLNNNTAMNTMRRGANPWNLAAGATHDFVPYAGHNQSRFWTGSTCSTASVDQTWIVSYPISGYLGLTSYCFSGGTIERVAIRVSSNYTYDINGGTVSSGQYDLEGLLVHEFGHATGFRGHFPETLCSGDTRQTMCSTMPSGWSFWRTLESHDEHTFASAY